MHPRAALRRLRRVGSRTAARVRRDRGVSTEWAAVAAHLRARPGAVVAVLGDREPDELTATIRRARRTVQVHLLDPRAPETELHARMAALGRFDLVVDLSEGPDLSGHLRGLFFHLAADGLWVVPAHESPDEALAELASRLVRLRIAPSSLEWAPKKDEQRLAAAVSSVVVAEGGLRVTNAVAGYAKLTEQEVNSYLELRGGQSGRVLAQRPGGEFLARGSWRMSESELARQPHTRFDVPPVYLREYLDVVCAPGQVVTQANVLLPDSYRHNRRARLHNGFLTDLAPRFSTTATRRPIEELELLEGAHFYLDSEYRGHFGHAMTEQLSRMWAWKQAKAGEPGLKVVMHHNKHRGLAQYEIDLYAAAGVQPDEIVFRKAPVRVERLIAATPMFSQPQYVNGDIESVWAEVGRNLAALATGGHPKRIFCARRIKKRSCHNAAEVEQLFADHGFTIMYTEDYPLAEQAAIFREAEVVAGFAGSALFNLVLADGPKKVIIVASESYTAKNEHMIAAVMGHEVNVAWCRADVEIKEDKYVKEAFHSRFTFDMDREGRFVREVLGSL